MKIRISNGMFLALIINMVYAKAIGLTQGSMAREIGGDMWIATIFSTLKGVVMILLMILIIRRNPNLNIFEQSELILGKWIGKLISLSAFIFFLGAAGVVFTMFVFHLKDYFLPEAPTILFVIAAMIIGVFAFFHGIEVIGRLAFIGVFSILILNILIILGSLGDFDITELMPVFRFGVISDLWASRYHDTDWTMAVMMTAVILPKVKNKETWGKSGVLGILLGGVFVIIWPILESGVLSAEVAGQYIISCMQMARSAEIGQFIHRYEMIMIALFSISALIQIIMTFYCATASIQSLFNIKDSKTVIFPVSIILCAFGYWIVLDHHRAIKFVESYWVTGALGISFGITFLLLLLGFIFKKKLKKSLEKAL
jgi:spore germination protein KB